MTSRHFRPLALGFVFASMFAAPLLQAQTSERPQSYSLTMISSMPQTATEKVYHNGARERIDLTAAPGDANPQEVHQVLFFDSQTNKAYAEDPASHECYSAQYPSADNLASYDPFFIPAGATPALLLPGGKLTGAETVNGIAAKLYEAKSKDNKMGIESTTKFWWSETYGFPVKMEVVLPNMPPMVMMEIKELVTSAPPASLFAAPSGCKEAQGQWTPAGFEASGQKTVTLGAVAAAPQAPPPSAPPVPVPAGYTIVEVNKLTEASMFTGQPSILDIYRHGSKERVDLKIAPWAKGPDGVRERFLFDFVAHKAYTTGWNRTVSSCSWIKYTSDDAPGNYDPFTGRAKSPMTPSIWGQHLQGVTVREAGAETINGMDAKVYEGVGADGKVYDKLWWSEQYHLALKMVMATPFAGMQGTLVEIKRLDFSTPQAALFAVPTGCSETKGEWSSTGLSGSASETVSVGTPSSQPSGAASSPSAGAPTAATPAPAAAPANLVVNGDFESGNTGFTSGYVYGNVNGPTTYTITTNPSQADGAYPDWYNGGDHTSGKGNMLVVNGANSATTPIWEETVTVTPNTTYTFSYWGAEVDHDSSSLPRLQLNINGSPVGDNSIQEKSPDNGGSWEKFTFTWNSGSSTSATLALFDLNTDTGWNDFALDDISFGAHPADYP
jgi:hypothetical protein